MFAQHSLVESKHSPNIQSTYTALEVGDRDAKTLTGSEHELSALTSANGESGTNVGPAKTQKPPIAKGIYSALVIVAIFCLASLITAIWLIIRVQSSLKGDYLNADFIGGRFTVTEAKLIDVVSSVLIAPLITGIINYHIFKLVKCAVLDERPPSKGYVSLETLIEVSVTDWGSYSLFKHFNLLKSLELRLVLLSAIVLGSALSFSFLTNVVAYEAFDFSSTASSIDLDYLYSPGTNISTSADEALDYLATQKTWETSYFPNLTVGQSRSFSTNLFQSLASLSDEPAKLLNDGAYINYNVSDSSLNKIGNKTYLLLDVPTINLTYTCEPSEIKNITMDGDSYKINVFIQASSESDSTRRTYVGGIRNLMPFLLGDFYRTWVSSRAQPLVAFSEKEVWLGMFEPKKSMSMFNETTEIESSFGTVSNFTHNNTQFLLDAGFTAAQRAASDEQNDMRVMNFFGVSCKILDQTFASSLSRTSNNEAGLLDWGLGSIGKDFEPPKRQGIHSMMLRDLQMSSVFSQSVVQDISGGPVPGLGAALTQFKGAWKGEQEDRGIDGVDFKKYADAFLYMEGEATTLAYQMAQADDKDREGPAPTFSSYSIRAEGQGKQVYAITYVPWVLLTALLSMFTATCLTLGMTLYSLGTFTLRSGRVLSPLRMAMDLGYALDSEDFGKSQCLEDSQLDKWAKGCRLRYRRADGNVVLCQGG